MVFHEYYFERNRRSQEHENNLGPASRPKPIIIFSSTSTKNDILHTNSRLKNRLFLMANIFRPQIYLVRKLFLSVVRERRLGHFRDCTI